MLFPFNVQYYAADIRFMYRTYYFGYYRESTSTGKIHDFLLFIGNKFIDQWNTGCVQQCLHIMRFDVSILRDGINDTTDSRYIDSEQFNLRHRRLRGVDNTGQCSSQSHFVGKVHVSFGKECRHFRSCCIDGGKNREYRLMTGLHLFMKDIVHFKHGHQSGCAEDSQDSIYIV